MGKNSSLASHVSKTMIMMSSNLVTMGITDMTMINATLELSKSWLLSQDFHISMLKPLLPLMTELVQWSFHHREQVPEALKEVWFSIVNFLDFNEVLGKDVHNETKKMFGGFLDSLSMYLFYQGFILHSCDDHSVLSSGQAYLRTCVILYADTYMKSKVTTQTVCCLKECNFMVSNDSSFKCFKRSIRKKTTFQKRYTCRVFQDAPRVTCQSAYFV